MGGTPVTDADRAEIRRLHSEGLGRNEIARQLGRSGRTISVQASAMGLVFDNAEMTDAATRNRKAQLAARRMDLAEALQEDAERLTEQMWEPAIVYSFGGKDSSLKLVPNEETAAEDEAKSMLGQLMVGLKVAYDDAQREMAAGPEEAGSEPSP
jgi:IS30 family transposase